MFTLDVYKKYMNKAVTGVQQTEFGRITILVAGVVISLFAMLLDGVSLLMINIFSSILFAASTAALILGLWLPKVNNRIASNLNTKLVRIQVLKPSTI